MLPLHINSSTSLISQRLGLKFPREIYKVIDGYLYFSSEYWRLFLQTRMLLLPFRLFQEMKIAKNRWLNEVIPRYQKKIDSISQLRITNYSLKAKLKLLKEIAELEGWFMAESIFVALFCGLAEILLKITYPLFVKNSPSYEYRDLLIGFPDKGLEADRKLWKIAQIKDSSKREQKIKNWTDKYGYRIQDKDLIYPVLGERKDLINSYLELYKNLPDPKIKHQQAEERRSDREKFVKENTKNIPILINIFCYIVFQAQNYAQIRNSRPFYYQGNKYIRRVLLHFASQTDFLKDHNDIFFLRIQELEAIVGKRVDRALLTATIEERKSVYNKQLKTEPPLEISI